MRCSKVVFVFVGLIAVFVSGPRVQPLKADVVDFETGLVDNQFLFSIVTATNQLTFAVDGGVAPTVAGVGGPITAFIPEDTPVGGDPGQFFLSNGSASVATQYYIVFANPISDLSIDLYDYSLQAGVGRLSLFGNDDFTDLVGLATFDPTNIDGGVITTSAESFTGAARSASLTFTVADPGNGIDNIRFNTVPEPTVTSLIGAFLLAVGSTRRRRMTVFSQKFARG